MKLKNEDYEANYFSTPNTALCKQRQVKDFENFDDGNECYRKNTSRTIIKKYKIKGEG